jgi:hypothetical protein
LWLRAYLDRRPRQKILPKVPCFLIKLFGAGSVLGLDLFQGLGFRGYLSFEGGKRVHGPISPSRLVPSSHATSRYHSPCTRREPRHSLARSRMSYKEGGRSSRTPVTLSGLCRHLRGSCPLPLFLVRLPPPPLNIIQHQSMAMR